MMTLFNLFGSKSSARPAEIALRTEWTAQGVVVPFPESRREMTSVSPPEDEYLFAYLGSLAAEEISEIRDDHAFISWENVYALLGNEEHADVIQLLSLPPSGGFRPILSSTGALSDESFSIEIEAWTDSKRKIRPERLEGAVITVAGQSFLLNEWAWKTVELIFRFAQRETKARTQHENELAWGKIRPVADQAGAIYSSPYLETTYVLTPQTLRLPLVREKTPFGRVLTVEPTFNGAPDGWLRAFDGYSAVQPHYDLTRGGGRTRVVLSEPVRKVLDVIKREMPGRRIAGNRAEKFIRNPWAFLGDAAQDVINEDDFEKDRANAGALYVTFGIDATVEQGGLSAVNLSISAFFSNDLKKHDKYPFSDADELAGFVSGLERAIKTGHEYFAWDEYDFTLDAESERQLDLARHFLFLWRNQPEQRILYDEIVELKNYSARIEGVGIAKPVYVPALPVRNVDGAWLPDNLAPVIVVQIPGCPEPVVVSVEEKWVDEFDKKVLEAEKSGASEVSDPRLPTPVPTAQAKILSGHLRGILKKTGKKKSPSGNTSRSKQETTLILKTNFVAVDYLEERAATLKPRDGATACLPACLRQQTELKQHQLEGITWFQHLVSQAPEKCRGALLADDMGLGKTLQLLVLLGWYYETNPDSAPSIILVPKSLRENWIREAKTFFTQVFPEILDLFDKELQIRKCSADEIDERLHAEGITNFLKPGWTGSAKIVITTYETLVRYEFSFALQPFAFVICDEAQRIKTPGTQVTLAAKKLKADFRIACTGTPVENSLLDLWCLFDFVQPGLLGALEAFSKTCRRPIECQTEEHEEALKWLQQTISPQTLRRTKDDIARDLTKKYFGLKSADSEKLQFKAQLEQHERLDIVMSEYQRNLYINGLRRMRDAQNESDGKTRMRLSFGALHFMKGVCAEPYSLPTQKFQPDSGGDGIHLENSPKMNWLLLLLDDVRKKDEKAIIFTEVRQVQLALSYFLGKRFKLSPSIINGDSEKRQTYIDRFSEIPGFNVIILSPLAAGAGLNITAANHVIHFTRTWNPAKESQATDRAYRIGQRRNVYVYCPTVRTDAFDTFEVRLDRLMKSKAGLASSALDRDRLTSMLNGTGGDIPISELTGGIADNTSISIPSRLRHLVLDDVDRMDGNSFEIFCSLLWSEQGYTTHVTEKKGGDGGIDVLGFKDNEGILLQCKSAANPSIGWDAIKEVVAGSTLYRNRHPATRFTKIAVTNRQFTSGAIEQARANDVQLVTRTEIQQWLEERPVTSRKFEELLERHFRG